MKIIERIQKAIKLLQESEVEFGKRFGVAGNTVNGWKNGKTSAPYHVIEFCEMILDNLQDCPACGGTGVFNKAQEKYIIAIGSGMDDVPFFGTGGSFTNIKPVRKYKLIAGEPEKFLIPSDQVNNQ